MKLLVVNNAAPFVRGGAELLADRLVVELRVAGHEAELVRLPLGTTPDSVLDGLIAAATLEAVNVDRVIGLKFPAYLLPHDDVVIWLVHQFRQVYDLGARGGRMAVRRSSAHRPRGGRRRVPACPPPLRDLAGRRGAADVVQRPDRPRCS